MNGVPIWRKFEEHFPHAAALVLGILFFLLVIVLRGFGGGASLVEWPLVLLLLANGSRPLAQRIAMLIPVSAGLPFVEGLAPGVYLAALIGALLIGEISTRRSITPGDHVAHVLAGIALVGGWVAARLMLGSGGDVLVSSLAAIVVVLLVWMACHAFNGVLFLTGRSRGRMQKVTLGPRGEW